MGSSCSALSTGLPNASGLPFFACLFLTLSEDSITPEEYIRQIATLNPFSSIKQSGHARNKLHFPYRMKQILPSILLQRTEFKENTCLQYVGTTGKGSSLVFVSRRFIGARDLRTGLLNFKIS